MGMFDAGLADAEAMDSGSDDTWTADSGSDAATNDATPSDADSADAADPSKELIAIRKCITSKLPPKDPAQADWIVSTFLVIDAFNGCRSELAAPSMDFRTAMEGFAEPVSDQPNQLRIL
jgi:hypothetical protein